VKLVQVIRQDSNYVYDIPKWCREEIFTEFESENLKGRYQFENVDVDERKY
jgi:hypothetical protein